MKVQMYWEVTPRRFLYGFSFLVHDSEGEDDVVFRNVCSYLTVEMV